MIKLTILLTGLGALGAATGVVLTANDNVPLGTVIVAAGVLLLSGALGLALRAGRKSASPAGEAPKQVPLRSRTDLSGDDKTEVWMAIQTMQRHHGHSDLGGLINSKKMGRSLDADDCQVCGQPRFQRGLRWLEEVLSR